MENPNSDEIPQNYQTENTWNTSEKLNSVGKAKIDSLKDIILEVET